VYCFIVYTQRSTFRSAICFHE